MTEKEALLMWAVRGQEIARLQRRLHASRERYKKVKGELRRCLLSEMVTAKFLHMMEVRVSGGKERMDKIAAHTRKVHTENIQLKREIEGLKIFIEGAKGKYL